MFWKTLALLSVLKVLFLSTPALANQAPGEKFYVYGRICKGVNLQGTFPTIQEACEAAAKYRGEGLTEVSVRTGTHDIRDELGTAATHYRIYRRGVRCGGWFLHTTVDNAPKANEIADQLKKQNHLSAVEIVRHYGKFFVYGGNCSRSIRLQGTYDTIADAAAAARKLRNAKLNYVTVRTGPDMGDYFGTAATQYQVYRRGCKSSWSLYATAYSAAAANEIGDLLKKASPRVEVEIVLSYSSNGSPG